MGFLKSKVLLTKTLPSVTVNPVPPYLYYPEQYYLVNGVSQNIIPYGILFREQVSIGNNVRG